MIQEIREMKNLLKSRRPYEREVYKEISLMNLCNVFYTDKKLSGQEISKEDVLKMIQGQLVLTGNMDDYNEINRYRNMLDTMKSMVEMGSELALKIFHSIYSMVQDLDPLDYRKSSPILYHIDYIPPHASDIPTQLKFLNPLSLEGEDEVAQAVDLHNKIIQIYPYEKGSEELARHCLYFFLMSRGYPPFTFGFSEIEYNIQVEKILKNGDWEGLYRGIQRSLFNKLDLLLRLTGDQDSI